MGQSTTQAAEKLVSDLRNTPERVADTLTLGPQRRAAARWVSKEYDKARDVVDKYRDKILGPPPPMNRYGPYRGPKTRSKKTTARSSKKGRR